MRTEAAREQLRNLIKDTYGETEVGVSWRGYQRFNVTLRRVNGDIICQLIVDFGFAKMKFLMAKNEPPVADIELWEAITFVLSQAATKVMRDGLGKIRERNIFIPVY
jgi:hypothetical protein